VLSRRKTRQSGDTHADIIDQVIVKGGIVCHRISTARTASAFDVESAEGVGSAVDDLRATLFQLSTRGLNHG